MGMFDDLQVDYPLPDPEAQALQFQTKDLLCELRTFRLTVDGRLEIRESDTEPNPDYTPDAKPFQRGYHRERYKVGSDRWVPFPKYTGHVRFYGSPRSGDLQPRPYSDEEPHTPAPWYEYVALFWRGQLVTIDGAPLLERVADGAT